MAFYSCVVLCGPVWSYVVLYGLVRQRDANWNIFGERVPWMATTKRREMDFFWERVPWTATRKRREMEFFGKRVPWTATRKRREMAFFGGKSVMDGEKKETRER